MSICLIAVMAQLSVTAIYTSLQEPFTMMSGVSATEYVARHRRASEDIRIIDSRLPERSQTLVAGVQELFWFNHDVRGGGNFDGERVARYLTSDVGKLRERLRRDGFTHIAIVTSRIRLGGASLSVKERERELVLEPAALADLQRFLRTQKLLSEDRGIVIYELR
jgi:hypothetical protein